jgi:mono/diheme cytochrome c family protein
MTWQRTLVVVGAAVVALASASACSSSGGSATAAPAPDPTSREASTAAKGGEAVVKRKCVTCHGMNMAGAVAPLPLAGITTDTRVELYPPNLTPDPDTGIGSGVSMDPAKKGYTDDLLARAIRSGIDNDDLELCPEMKHFADMTDFEVYSIVKYLRALPPVNQKILRSVCPPLKTKDEQTTAP